MQTYKTILQEKNVEMKSPVLDRKPLPKPSSIQDLNEIVAPQKLPTDYLNYLMEIGPGVCGKCRVFGVLKPINHFDFRFHSHRLNKLRMDTIKEFVERNEQALPHGDEMYVFFANHVDEEDLWFAYKVTSDDMSEERTIYVMDMDSEAIVDTLPKRICKNGFAQFLSEICLGDRLAEKQVQSARRQREEDEEDDDGEDNQEQISYSFVPFGLP